jgi:hypothetical protein
MVKYKICDIHPCDDPLGLKKVLILQSEWNDSIPEVILANKVEKLALVLGMGWPGKNIDFLSKLPHLRGLCLNTTKTDLAPLYSLNNLEDLQLEVPSLNKFELKQFPKLKKLSIPYHKKILGLTDCVNLEELYVTKYPYESLEELRQINKLVRLTIHSRKLTSTKGIEKLKEMKDLQLALCPSLSSLGGVSSLKELKTINLHSCKGVNSLDELRNLENLQFVYLENCGEIDTLSPLSGCKQLRRIGIANTTVADEDSYGVEDELPLLEYKIFRMQKKRKKI